MGLMPLINEARMKWLDYLIHNAYPLCPDLPKWVLKRRQISTGKWY